MSTPIMSLINGVEKAKDELINATNEAVSSLTKTASDLTSQLTSVANDLKKTVDNLPNEIDPIIQNDLAKYLSIAFVRSPMPYYWAWAGKDFFIFYSDSSVSSDWANPLAVGLRVNRAFTDTHYPGAVHTWSPRDIKRLPIFVTVNSKDVFVGTTAYINTIALGLTPLFYVYGKVKDAGTTPTVYTLVVKKDDNGNIVSAKLVPGFNIAYKDGNGFVAADYPLVIKIVDKNGNATYYRIDMKFGLDEGRACFSAWCYQQVTDVKEGEEVPLYKIAPKSALPITSVQEMFELWRYLPKNQGSVRWLINRLYVAPTSSISVIEVASDLTVTVENGKVKVVKSETLSISNVLADLYRFNYLRKLKYVADANDGKIPALPPSSDKPGASTYGVSLVGDLDQIPSEDEVKIILPPDWFNIRYTFGVNVNGDDNKAALVIVALLQYQFETQDDGTIKVTFTFPPTQLHIKGMIRAHPRTNVDTYVSFNDPSFWGFTGDVEYYRVDTGEHALVPPTSVFSYVLFVEKGGDVRLTITEGVTFPK